MFGNKGQNPQDFFSAEPKVVQPRVKYRPPQEELPPLSTSTNIMWDRRVQRGNTYASSMTSTREVAQTIKGATQTKKKFQAKPINTTGMESVQADVSTPRPVDGRRHADAQTDENVELLTDKPPEFEREAQTDFYIDRPVNRLFVPQKIGEDKETQIEAGELFDFDQEVEPILQALLGRTLEQGRMEVLEEEEVRVMKEEQKRYDEQRYAELVEAQKMEAEEKRKFEEHERRSKQHKLNNNQSVASHKKFVSRLIAKEYTKNLRGDAFNGLRDQGNFRTPFDVELSNTFLPWIFGDIINLENAINAAQSTIANASSAVAVALANLHLDAINGEKDRKRKIQEDKERKEQEKIERRQQRAELRKRREEEERIRALQETIGRVLIARSEPRQGVFNQVLSDVDALGKESGTVGLLGGVIGELAILVSTLEDLKNIDEHNHLAGLRAVQITPEIVEKIVERVINQTVKDGTVEVGVTNEALEQLEAIDPSLSLDNLDSVPEKAAEITEVLRNSITSFGLSAIRQYADEIRVSPGSIEAVTDAIIKMILTSDEAKKIKLVSAPSSYNEDTRTQALVVFMPALEGLPKFNLMEAKGVKPKRRRKNSKRDSINALDDAGTTEEDELQITDAEVDYGDVVSVPPLTSEEFRIMIHQNPVSIALRRDVLIFLSSIFKELDMKELEVLAMVNRRAEGIEEVITRQCDRKVPVLTYDKI